MIEITNAPAIPGLLFRHFEGEGDYPKIARVITASENADHSSRQATADDIAKAYLHMSNCDPYRDTIFAEVSGEVVGYTRGWWSDESAPQRMYKHNAFLLPEWRRKGIGHAMLEWIEQRLGEIAAAHPPEMAKFFEVNTTQFQQGTSILLERSGYQPVRYFYLMVRPTLDAIEESPLPAGLEIRPVLPEHYRLIWNFIDETSQDEWGHKKLTESDYHEWLTSDNFQPDLWQVAWETVSDHVIGQVLTFIQHDENKQFNRRRGYTEGIGVARRWRKRGVASALISKSLLAQKAAGMTESALSVDSENPSGATHLYENCGFQIVKKDTLYRKLMDV